MIGARRRSLAEWSLALEGRQSFIELAALPKDLDSPACLNLSRCPLSKLIETSRTSSNSTKRKLPPTTQAEAGSEDETELQAVKTDSEVLLCQTCRSRPVYEESDGRKHPYCGLQCAGSAKRPYDTTLRRRGTRASSLTSPTNTWPKTVEIDEKDCRFSEEVSDLFQKRWSTDSGEGHTAVTIERIFAVNYQKNKKKAAKKHTKNLSKTGAFLQYDTFFSSQCICNFGASFQDPQSLCRIKSCGICMALSSDFRSFAFEAPHCDGRFGPGIYSKRYGKAADRHATSCTTSPYRIMVICKVIVMGTDGEISSDRNTGCARIDDDTIMVENPKDITAKFVICYTIL